MEGVQLAAHPDAGSRNDSIDVCDDGGWPTSPRWPATMPSGEVPGPSAQQSQQRSSDGDAGSDSPRPAEWGTYDADVERQWAMRGSDEFIALLGA